LEKKKIGPPSFPWKKGHNDEYSKFSLEVQICQCVTGEIWSVHDWGTPEDEEVASGLYSGGQEQIVFALFTEAVRREAFLEVLIEQSRTGDFLERSLNEETREEIKRKLVASVLHMSKDLVEKLAGEAVSEVLTMLTSEIPR